MIFLTLDEVLAIHAEQIERYGGTAGVRDVGLIASALGMPQQTFGGEYVHSSIWEMAAAYLFHIVKNHGFVDGNKRVGLATALLFLGLNDIDVSGLDEDVVVTLVERTATGEASKADIAVFFASRLKERK